MVYALAQKMHMNDKKLVLTIVLRNNGCIGGIQNKANNKV